jgi:hypothetical protein
LFLYDENAWSLCNQSEYTPPSLCFGLSGGRGQYLDANGNLYVRGCEAGVCGPAIWNGSDSPRFLSALSDWSQLRVSNIQTNSHGSVLVTGTDLLGRPFGKVIRPSGDLVELDMSGPERFYPSRNFHSATWIADNDVVVGYYGGEGSTWDSRSGVRTGTGIPSQLLGISENGTLVGHIWSGAHPCFGKGVVIAPGKDPVCFSDLVGVQAAVMGVAASGIMWGIYWATEMSPQAGFLWDGRLFHTAESIGFPPCSNVNQNRFNPTLVFTSGRGFGTSCNRPVVFDLSGGKVSFDFVDFQTLGDPAALNLLAMNERGTLAGTLRYSNVRGTPWALWILR